MADKVLFYMAPMEGLTGYVFRNIYAKYFHDMDKYFTPFISSVGFSHKELHDILPEHNEGLRVVPQIMTNRSEEFLAIAQKLKDFGYEEVNLNLGCPSGTVVSKGRGAGFLRNPGMLEHFLDEIFEKCPLPISVKTRIGVQSEEEWAHLAEIFNRFEMTELIIHPRLLKDYYRGSVRQNIFREALQSMNAPVCYNGDIHCVGDFERLRAAFPEVDRVMFGRGIFKDPGLVGECRAVLAGEDPASRRVRAEVLKELFGELLDGYRQEMGNDTHTLYKMKEIWTYFGENLPAESRALKRILKAKTLTDYRIAAREAFEIMLSV